LHSELASKKNSYLKTSPYWDVWSGYAILHCKHWSIAIGFEQKTEAKSSQIFSLL